MRSSRKRVINYGNSESKLPTRVYLVLFAQASTRKHKKWESEGKLLAKPYGINMLRFELQEDVDGEGTNYHTIFDELVRYAV